MDAEAKVREVVELVGLLSLLDRRSTVRYSVGREAPARQFVPSLSAEGRPRSSGRCLTTPTQNGVGALRARSILP